MSITWGRASYGGRSDSKYYIGICYILVMTFSCFLRSNQIISFPLGRDLLGSTLLICYILVISFWLFVGLYNLIVFVGFPPGRYFLQIQVLVTWSS